MIGKRRRVIAGVVRRDDDVPLRCEERRQGESLRILHVRHIEGAVRGGAMSVQEDGARSGAAGAKTGRHHQRSGGRGGFVRSTDRRVLDVIEKNVAVRRAAESQQLLIGREIEFEQQIRRRDGG